MTSDDIVQFRSSLLSWYKDHKRSMPWRETDDPYQIWISEVMLQQTQVATVIDYFNRFIQRFPDIKTLAQAEFQDILKLWEGLGYYSRARNLHKAVNQLVDQNMYEVPNTPDAFLKLSGVGPYTCAAVQSIAFGHPLAVVDGNVKRVLSRFYELETPVNDSCVHEDFNSKATELLDTAAPSSFNQAMMELGALICKPSAPLCESCPVISFCMAHTNDQVASFPKRKNKPKTPTRKHVAGLIQVEDTFLIVQRKHNGFLGGLWELPGGLVKKNGNLEKTLIAEIKNVTGYDVLVNKQLPLVKHAYTHFKLELTVFACSITGGVLKLTDSRASEWISLDEIDEYPFHKAIHKCFAAIGEMV